MPAPTTAKPTPSRRQRPRRGAAGSAATPGDVARVAVTIDAQGRYYAVGWTGATQLQLDACLDDVHAMDLLPADFVEQRRVIVELPLGPVAGADGAGPPRGPSPLAAAVEPYGALERARDRIYGLLASQGPLPFGVILTELGLEGDVATEALTHRWFFRRADGLFETRNAQERARAPSRRATCPKEWSDDV